MFAATSLATTTPYRAGNFSNESYALSSFALSQSQCETLTAFNSYNDASAESGSSSGTEQLTVSADNGFLADAGKGTFTQSGSSLGSAQQTQTESWTLVEQGTFAGGNFNLSCYLFTQQQNSSDSSSDSGSWNDNFSGTNQSLKGKKGTFWIR